MFFLTLLLSSVFFGNKAMLVSRVPQSRFHLQASRLSEEEGLECCGELLATSQTVSSLL